MIYGRNTTSGMHGWHGVGWYTIAMSNGCKDWTYSGTAWYDVMDDLNDDATIARMASNSDYVADVDAWYRGHGMLPDAVQSYVRNRQYEGSRGARGH